jgi:hypothetical protein
MLLENASAELPTPKEKTAVPYAGPTTVAQSLLIQRGRRVPHGGCHGRDQSRPLPLPRWR